MDGRQVLLWGRVPALVGLLAVVGRFSVAKAETAEGALRLQPINVWPSWIALVLTAVAFLAVALAGRQRLRHPPGALIAEGLIAAVLGLVPPIQWIQWLGVNAFVTTAGFHQSAVSFIQPLALAWLVIVTATGWRQFERAKSLQ